MPFYDFRCADCESEFETFHSIKDTPEVLCPVCKSKKTHKVPSLCGIIVRSGTFIRKAKDTIERSNDHQEELKATYGIERVSARGGDLEAAYRDVKQQSSLVKEQMAAKKEQGDAQRRAKRKEWMKGALKRAPARNTEMAKRKAAEKVKERRITI